MQINSFYENEILIRKLRCKLIVYSRAVMFFGIWSILKGITYLIFDPGDFNSIIGESDHKIEIYIVIYSIVIIILLVLDLLPRYIAARSCIKEAKNVVCHNKKKSIWPIIICLYLLISTIFSLIVTLMPETDEKYLDQLALGVLVDFISIYISFGMIISLIRLRRLLKINEGDKL